MLLSLQCIERLFDMSKSPLSLAVPEGRSFAALIWGQLLSRLGWSACVFAIPLFVIDETHSLVLTGLISSLSLISGFSTMLPMGVVVDRFSRIHIIQLSYSCIACVTALTLVFFVWGHAAVTSLFIVIVCGGIANNMSGPGVVAILRSSVPKESLGRAFSIEQGRANVVSIAGGPIGGILYSIHHMAPFLACVVLQLVAILMTLFVKEGSRPVAISLKKVSEWTLGIRYLFRKPTLMLIGILGCITNLSLYGVLYGLIFGFRVQYTSSSSISLIEMSAGIGGLIATPLAAKYLDRLRVGYVAAISSVLLAIGLLIASLGANIIAAVIGFALCGFVLVPWNASLFGYLAAATDVAYQGRVQSAVSILSGIASPLAPALVAPTISLLGMRDACLAFTLLAIAAALCQFQPAIFHIRHLDDYAK